VNTAIAITAIIAALLAITTITSAIKDVAREKHKARQYPRQDGDFTVLGPEIFTDRAGDVISWKGVNYVRQDTKENSA
jgi:cytochrome oxidase Cu insertion factor (SCO1/SenC/PrrC family)